MLITRIFSSAVVSFFYVGIARRAWKASESLLCFCLLSYLAWWSFDYLCEKLDLTCKRNHISSFFYFSPFLLLLHHQLSAGLIVCYAYCFYIYFFSLILMTFWFTRLGSLLLHPTVCDMILISFFIQIWPRTGIEWMEELNLNKSRRSLSRRNINFNLLFFSYLFSVRLAVTKRQPSCCPIHGYIIITPCNRKFRWAWLMRARAYHKSPTTITLINRSLRSTIRCINFISHTISKVIRCTAITMTTPHLSVILIITMT